jgi:hypothetical protein
MSIARLFNRTLHRQLKCYAAWPPFANGYQLGDYGAVSGGVFQRLGNIAEFGVAVTPAPETPEASLNFVSEKSTIVRVAGEAEVNVFPDEPIAARLSFGFEGKESLLLKARTIRMREMTNVAAAGRVLAKAAGWRHRYKVIRQVWTATDGLVLATRDTNTKVTFGATAGVLKRLELGDVSVDVDITADHGLGLEMVGKTGPIGLGLFRVRLFGGVATRDLATQKDRDFDPTESSVSWPEDLEDDL